MENSEGQTEISVKTNINNKFKGENKNLKEDMEDKNVSTQIDSHNDQIIQKDNQNEQISTQNDNEETIQKIQCELYQRHKTTSTGSQTEALSESLLNSIDKSIRRSANSDQDSNIPGDDESEIEESLSPSDRETNQLREYAGLKTRQSKKIVRFFTFPFYFRDKRTKFQKPKYFIRTFVVGVLLGGLLLLYLLKKEMIDLVVVKHVETIQEQVNLTSLLDGYNITTLQTLANDIRVHYRSLINSDPTINLEDIKGPSYASFNPNNFYDINNPGLEALSHNYTARFPVVLLPGFVSSGLEVWQGKECSRNYFRQRFWGQASMVLSMMFINECWGEHMMLDPETDLDPPGIKLRAAEGMQGSDFFITGYWVWAKIIEGLAAIGYDQKNLYMATHDWRLNMQDVEKRDSFYTRLKANIELLYETNGKQKVVILAHSYGSNMLLYFFKWVESKNGGKGGDSWVDKYIHTYVDIAGPLLGVPKALSSYLSGEMSDTSELGPIEALFNTNIKLISSFNRNFRQKLFRSWGSLTAMLPKGGEFIWGDHNSAPEDFFPPPADTDETDLNENDDSYIEILKEGNVIEEFNTQNQNISEISTDEKDRVAKDNECEFPVSKKIHSVDVKQYETFDSNYNYVKKDFFINPISMGNIIQFSSNGDKLSETISDSVTTTKEAYDDNSSSWHGNDETKLPTLNANTNISYSIQMKEAFLSKGNWTINQALNFLHQNDSNLARRMDKNYNFEFITNFKNRTTSNFEKPEYWSNSLAVQLPKAPNMRIYCFYGVGKQTERAFVYKRGDGPSSSSITNNGGSIGTIDISVKNSKYNIKEGVIFDDGDGSVPLVSLGYHCANLWRNSKAHNPSNIPVTTREIIDNVPSFVTGLIERSKGSKVSSQDHVDIMGNYAMIYDILKIVSGNDDDDLFQKDRFYSQIRELSDRISKKVKIN